MKRRYVILLVVILVMVAIIIILISRGCSKSKTTEINQTSTTASSPVSHLTQTLSTTPVLANTITTSTTTSMHNTTLTMTTTTATTVLTTTTALTVPTTTAPTIPMEIPKVGSNWVYTVTYSDPNHNCNNTVTQTFTMENLNSLPEQPEGSTLTPPNAPCFKLHVDYGSADRYSKSDIETIWQSADGWFSRDNLELLYGVLRFTYMGTPYTSVGQVRNVKLTAGTNVGLPFKVGNSWTYDETDATISVPDSLSYSNYTEIVEADHQSVTTTGGKMTFDDCVKISTYDTQDHTLLWTDYYSPTVMRLVKEIDYSFSGTQTMTLVSYTLVK